MTAHTITPHGHHHLSVRTAVFGVAGAGVAIGAAFGISNLLSGEGTTVAPGPEPRVVITDGARDSWEGRIGPESRGAPTTTEREYVDPSLSSLAQTTHRTQLR